MFKSCYKIKFVSLVVAFATSPKMWTMYRPQAGHLLKIYICIRVSDPESLSPDPDLDLDFISDLNPDFLRPKIVIF